MKTYTNTRATIALGITLIACFLCSVLFLHRINEEQGSKLVRESLYISSPPALRRISLGYTGLLADIYWTRAVQYFGNHHRRRADEYDLLAPLLDITTTLDPKLIVAYRFGATFLVEPPPQGAGQPDKAVDLVERGIRNNPGDWHLYYDLGFLQAWGRHDYAAASRAFAEGANLPNSNPNLRVLAAAYASRGGDDQTSMLLWRTTYETAENEDIRNNAKMHVLSLRSDFEIEALSKLIAKFLGETGRYPTSFSELINARLLQGYPLDPTGRPYKLLPDGEIQVQDPDAMPFIRLGKPLGWKPKIFTGVP